MNNAAGVLSLQISLTLIEIQLFPNSKLQSNNNEQLASIYYIILVENFKTTFLVTQYKQAERKPSKDMSEDLLIIAYCRPQDRSVCLGHNQGFKNSSTV